MQEDQKTVCLELINAAREKKEVVDAMIALYPKMERVKVKTIVDKEWKRRSPSGKVSIRSLSMKDRRIAINGVIMGLEMRKIQKAYVYIKKTYPKEIPYDLYELIIGKEKTNARGRSLLRGRKVELLGLTAYSTQIEVLSTEIGASAKSYFFSIHDIDARYYIEVE